MLCKSAYLTILHATILAPLEVPIFIEHLSSAECGSTVAWWLARLPLTYSPNPHCSRIVADVLWGCFWEPC